MSNEQSDIDISRIPLLTKLDTSGETFVRAPVLDLNNKATPIVDLSNYLVKKVIAQFNREDVVSDVLSTIKPVLLEEIKAKLCKLSPSQFTHKYAHHWAERQLSQ